MPGTGRRPGRPDALNHASRRPARSRIRRIMRALISPQSGMAGRAASKGRPRCPSRWCDEVIALLAAKAPRLDRALRKIAKRGGEVVLIDGTLIPTRRRTGGDSRPNYSGKHKRHGLHFLALTDENGRLIWISAARPGR